MVPLFSVNDYFVLGKVPIIMALVLAFFLPLLCNLFLVGTYKCCLALPLFFYVEKLVNMLKALFNEFWLVGLLFFVPPPGVAT